jgi:hypothetical protein
VKRLAICLALASCTPAQQAAGVNLAVCILTTYSTDIAAGETDVAAIADTIAKCGTDAVSVATTLDASRAAQLRMTKGK